MTPTTIKKALDRHFKTDIANRKRTSNYLFYRDIYFELALMYCYPKYSYRAIGEPVNRDHATVLHFTKKTARYPRHNEKMMYFIERFGNPTKAPNNQTLEILRLKEELANLKGDWLFLEYDRLKKENEALTQRHENLKKQKNDFVVQLNELPKETQELVRQRFSLILDAESKKVYSYSEKRRNELKTA